MTIKGKRIFNFRPLCLSAVALVLGILIAECLYGEHLALLAIPLSTFALTLVLFAVKKSWRKFLVFPFAFIIGFSSLSISNAVYDAHLRDEYSGSFTATIASEIIIEDGKATLYVSDICVDGVKLKYGAYLVDYLQADEEGDYSVDYHIGDVVQFGGRVVPNSHNKFDTYYAQRRINNIGYICYTSSQFVIGSTGVKFPLNFQIAIKKVLNENLNPHTASICQALLLGDKRSIDEGLYSNIKASGLAHLLAVSGLHISTLAMAVYFLLKKCKVNPKICFSVVVVLTFVYSMLCSFTASSLRAFIMSGVAMFASTFGQKKDDLSSLSLSAILILLFRPTAIMEIGFLLSFSAVLGIFLFYAPFERVGLKIVERISPKRHFGKRFAKVCALSFATNLMTYPFVAYFFNQVPVLFVLSNFIVLPYIMVVFLLLIVLTLLSLITHFGGFVWVMNLLFIPFRAYVGAIGSWGFSTIPVSIGIGGIITFVFVALFVSRYVFLTKRQKVSGAFIISSLGMALSTLLAFV